MRKINKSCSPEWFEKWKTDFMKKEARIPKYHELTDDKRRLLRSQLIDEQGKICCYCMKRINVDNSHIEHFRPRSKFTDLEMDYDNMFASCTGQIEELIDDYLHCDPKKGDWFDLRMPELTSEEIEKCLRYTIDGKVSPYHSKSNKRYEFEKLLIEKLGLNAPFLVRNRRQALLKSEIYEDADYTSDDWLDFMSYYDQMHDGEYEEYCMMFVGIMGELV